MVYSAGGASVVELLHAGVVTGGHLLAAATMIYALIALAAAFVRATPSTVGGRGLPSVSILKPLFGVQAETYECLRSFCNQDYPDFQLIFGVSDATDPVLCVCKRLQNEFPHLDLQIMVDRRLHGRNRKVSNLINMMPLARHEFLVLADSDVRVGRDYLGSVVMPLLDAGVGIVTCPYRGVHRGDLWSLLGSHFINDWFMPSVRVAAIGRSQSFAFGASIAIRRQVLAKIGGFTAVANQLADDYRLGELTRQLGLRTVLSDIVVDTFVAERSFAKLVHHELRWLRTIRAVRPVGYGFSFVTFGVATASLGMLMAGCSRVTIGMAVVTLAARTALHLRHVGVRESRILLVPVRDVLTLCLWSWGFVRRRVRWGEDQYRVSRDGSFAPV